MVGGRWPQSDIISGDFGQLIFRHLFVVGKQHGYKTMEFGYSGSRTYELFFLALGYGARMGP